MFYKINPCKRYFDKDRLYSDIDWSKLDQVVNAFGQRIRDWYLDPARELARNGHFAFSVMALACLLIDTLSQFHADKKSSTAHTFKGFVRDRLPKAYSEALTTPIRHLYWSTDEQKQKELTDVADVLYHGFRCGILHEAHITPYGLVDPGLHHQPVAQHASGHLKYAESGAECPSVVLNPLELVEDLSCALRRYLRDLKDRDPRYDELRKNFKAKFTRSFGVDVHSAA